MPGRSIWLIAPTRLRAYHGLYRLYFPESVGPGEREAHWQTVFCEGRASYTEAYLGVPHEKEELGIYSVAAVPVLGPSGAVIGALAAASSSPHRFTPIEQETLEAVGREIGGLVRRAVSLQDQGELRDQGCGPPPGLARPGGQGRGRPPSWA